MRAAVKAETLHFDRPEAHEPDRLILGDNLDVLASLPDGCVDLIYMDPPFGTGTIRKGGTEQGHARRYRDVPGDPDRYVDWIRERLAQSRRVLDRRGSLFVHLDYRAVHYVKVELDRLFGRDCFVNEIAWCYSVGGKSRRSFGRKHDTILWYGRTGEYTFYPDAVKVPRKPGSHMRVVQTKDGELVQEKTDRKTGKVYRYPLSAGKVPEDWWTDIESLNRGDRERTGWPTQKPEKLLERIIKCATEPGALVADWFAGSGTTGVVAQKLDRRFVLVDCEPQAVACARDRLDASGRALAEAGTRPRTVTVEPWQTARQIRLRL